MYCPASGCFCRFRCYNCRAPGRVKNVYTQMAPLAYSFLVDMIFC